MTKLPQSDPVDGERNARIGAAIRRGLTRSHVDLNDRDFTSFITAFKRNGKIAREVLKGRPYEAIVTLTLRNALNEIDHNILVRLGDAGLCTLINDLIDEINEVCPS